MSTQLMRTGQFFVLAVFLAVAGGAQAKSPQESVELRVPSLLAQDTTVTRQRVEVLKSNRTEDPVASSNGRVADAQTAAPGRAQDHNSSRSNKTSSGVAIDDDSDADGTAEVLQGAENPLYNESGGGKTSPLYQGSQR